VECSRINALIGSSAVRASFDRADPEILSMIMHGMVPRSYRNVTAPTALNALTANMSVVEAVFG
jgi:hypothetical protein